MLKFYFNGSPNPTKVALFLEEAGLPYEAIPSTRAPGSSSPRNSLKINPNGKVPAIVDGGDAVFDSNAILLYLAEKTGKFLPRRPRRRAEMLSWLMFVASGVGPYTGQAVHFRHSRRRRCPMPRALSVRGAPALPRAGRPLPIAAMCRRHLHDRRHGPLGLGADDPVRARRRRLGEASRNVKRLEDEINERPAAARAKGLKDEIPFKAEMDAEARRNMFKHTAA